MIGKGWDHGNWDEDLWEWRHSDEARGFELLNSAKPSRAVEAVLPPLPEEVSHLLPEELKVASLEEVALKALLILRI